MRTVTESENITNSHRTRRLLYLASATDTTSPKVWALEKDVNKSFKKVVKKEIRALNNCYKLKTRVQEIADRIRAINARLKLDMNKAKSEEKLVIAQKIDNLAQLKSKIYKMQSKISDFIELFEEPKGFFDFSSD